MNTRRHFRKIPTREEYQKNFYQGKFYAQQYMGERYTNEYIVWANPKRLPSNRYKINYKYYEIVEVYNGPDFNWPFANYIRGRKYLMRMC